MRFRPPQKRYPTQQYLEKDAQYNKGFHWRGGVSIGRESEGKEKAGEQKLSEQKENWSSKRQSERKEVYLRFEGDTKTITAGSVNLAG